MWAGVVGFCHISLSIGNVQTFLVPKHRLLMCGCPASWVTLLLVVLMLPCAAGSPAEWDLSLKHSLPSSVNCWVHVVLGHHAQSS